jgi:hypothetical protein
MRLVRVNAPSRRTGPPYDCDATCAKSIVAAGRRPTSTRSRRCNRAVEREITRSCGNISVNGRRQSFLSSRSASPYGFTSGAVPVAVPDFRLVSVEPPPTLAGPEGSPRRARPRRGWLQRHALSRLLRANMAEAERLAGPDPPPPIPPLRAAACRVICACLGHATDLRLSALPGVDTDETCKAQCRCSETQRGRARRDQSDLSLYPCRPTPSQYSQYSSFPGLSLALPCLWSLPPFPMADTDGPACAPAVSWSPISSLSQVRNQPSSTQPLAALGFDCCEATCPIYAAQVTVSDRHSRIARQRQYIAKSCRYMSALSVIH